LAHPSGNSIEPVAAVATPSSPAISAGPGHAQPRVARTRAAANTATGGTMPAQTADSALRAAVEKVAAQLITAGQSLQLSIDSESNRTIVVVRDLQTGTVIRQMPSEEMLRLASTLGADSHVLLDLTA